MPTFCRHNRFLERCPICSKDLPGNAPSGGQPGRVKRSTGAAAGSSSRSRRRGAQGLRVRREGRAEDDGYSSPLIPGVRASADASRLAQEIAFASGRLLALGAAPPGSYGDARALAASDIERATWTCFLTAYLSPSEDEDPFAGIHAALDAAPTLADQPPEMSEIALGPRSSHDPARGGATLLAYRQWVARAGAPDGTQARAFNGDPAWSAERRFERLFERLALPGLGRTGRYELLVTLGRLGLYDVRPDSLHLSGVSGAAGGDDPCTVAAKRVFGIGDPMLLDRRASTLAEAIAVPVEALDLALANWGSTERATLGCPPETLDAGSHERAISALAL
jgi:Alpha-glutamyl/putrescinyl thymine pyrophosphorylase clade 3